jgi:arylsulfatase A-like enzyme
MSSDFAGVIGPTWRESRPWWPPAPRAPDGAPNIMMIVLDDVGFAQLGCYGSDLDTPNIDQLAQGGVRLTNFHTTALCSPTRACLLTGRNHHSVGMGRIADLAIGFPGHYGSIGREHGFASEILAANGYLPVAVGKWHLTPDTETHMAADRSTWPTGRGFQRWYGFHGGETHQFVPTLFQDNHWVEPPTAADDDYHLTTDLADRLIAYLGELRAVDADSPFFAYLATGACHSPHHAPAELIEQYAGRFDEGWDVWRDRTFQRQLDQGIVPPHAELTPRPPWVPAWTELSADDQRVAARFMECFAAFLTHTDEQIGRVLRFVDEQLGALDDTLVVVVSDNGASSEGGKHGSINDVRTWNGIPAGRRELRERIGEIGGPTSHNNYPWGWTMAGNTPFRRWKREVHEGGVADPCIVHWPAGLDVEPSARRDQYVHAIDVLPTLLALAGVEPPYQIDHVVQTPLEGSNFESILRDPAAPPTRTTQYYEMLGSRAIYHDGWKAVTFKPLGHLYDDGIDPDAPFEDDRWELYHVAADPTECHDLAGDEPDRLQSMIDRWWAEARAHQVLPLDNRPLAALEAPRPSRSRDRARYIYHPHLAPVPEAVAVNVRNRSHSIAVEVELPDDRLHQGVLLSLGSVLGGWSLYLLDGVLRYEHNVAGAQRHQVTATHAPLSVGAHVLGFEFTSNGDFSGRGRLFVDDVEVGAADIPFTTPARFSIGGSGLTCGYEVGPAVTPDYPAPFRFTGTIHRAVVDVSGSPYRDLAADLAAILSEQ